jgi:hypothetical protein
LKNTTIREVDKEKRLKKLSREVRKGRGIAGSNGTGSQ